MDGRTEIMACGHHHTDLPGVLIEDEMRSGNVLVRRHNRLFLGITGLIMDRLQNSMIGMALLGMVGIRMKEAGDHLMVIEEGNGKELTAMLVSDRTFYKMTQCSFVLAIPQ